MVTTVRGDAALAEEASAALDAAGSITSRPLTVVAHAGAVLDPAVLSNVSFRSVRTEYSGKVRLTNCLHKILPCCAAAIGPRHASSCLSTHFRPV